MGILNVLRRRTSNVRSRRVSAPGRAFRMFAAALAEAYDADDPDVVAEDVFSRWGDKAITDGRTRQIIAEIRERAS